ncbi:hypothetical protein PRIC1_005357 [Phytophthora ramorum]
MKTALNVGTLAVERKETWTEMSFLDGVASVECHTDQLHLTPDTIKGILGRVPARSVAHLVLVTSLQGVGYRKQDRKLKERMEKALRSMEEFHHAHLYRVLVCTSGGTGSGSQMDLAPVRYMKNECRASACSTKPACRVDRLVFFLELSGYTTP